MSTDRAVRQRQFFGKREAERKLAYSMFHIAVDRWGQVVTSGKLSVVAHRQPGGRVTLTAWYKRRRVALFRLTAGVIKLENAGIRMKGADKWWPILVRLACRRKLVMSTPEPTHTAPSMLQ
jgi:hypothetical protein